MDDEADDQIGKSKEYWVGATAYTPKTTMLLTEPKNLKIIITPYGYVVRSLKVLVELFQKLVASRPRKGGRPPQRSKHTAHLLYGRNHT